MNYRKTYLIFLVLLIIVVGCADIGIVHQHIRQHLHYEHLVKVANAKRHHHHYVLWHPVKNAQKHPTAHNLAQLNLKRPYNNSALILKHNHSTLDPHAWHYDHVHFSHRDNLNRVSYPATAYLDRENVTGDALRLKQHVKPVAWHQHNYNGSFILNRGHLVAYSLTKNIDFKGHHSKNHVIGNQNDKNNLFTETAFCNQQLQYAFETRVRVALEHGKHIIYRAQPIFYKNDLMAKGIHLQAVSTDKKIHFNVYLFNVQPGVQFDYLTGRATPASNYQFGLPTHLIQHSEHLDTHDKHMHWQRQIMEMYQTHQISRQQAIFDEEQNPENYAVKY